MPYPMHGSDYDMNVPQNFQWTQNFESPIAMKPINYINPYNIPQKPQTQESKTVDQYIESLKNIKSLTQAKDDGQTQREIIEKYEKEIKEQKEKHEQLLLKYNQSVEECNNIKHKFEASQKKLQSHIDQLSSNAFSSYKGRNYTPEQMKQMRRQNLENKKDLIPKSPIPNLPKHHSQIATNIYKILKNACNNLDKKEFEHTMDNYIVQFYNFFKLDKVEINMTEKLLEQHIEFLLITIDEILNSEEMPEFNKMQYKALLNMLMYVMKYGTHKMHAKFEKMQSLHKTPKVQKLVNIIVNKLNKNMPATFSN